MSVGCSRVVAVGCSRVGKQAGYLMRVTRPCCVRLVAVYYENLVMPCQSSCGLHGLAFGGVLVAFPAGAAALWLLFHNTHGGK